MREHKCARQLNKASVKPLSYTTVKAKEKDIHRSTTIYDTDSYVSTIRCQYHRHARETLHIPLSPGKSST